MGESIRIAVNGPDGWSGGCEIDAGEVADLIWEQCADPGAFTAELARHLRACADRAHRQGLLDEYWADQ